MCSRSDFAYWPYSPTIISFFVGTRLNVPRDLVQWKMVVRASARTPNTEDCVIERTGLTLASNSAGEMKAKDGAEESSDGPPQSHEGPLGLLREPWAEVAPKTLGSICLRGP